jgi:hypothetical protein
VGKDTLVFEANMRFRLSSLPLSRPFCFPVVPLLPTSFRHSALPQPPTERVREDACVYLYAFPGGAETHTELVFSLSIRKIVCSLWFPPTSDPFRCSAAADGVRVRGRVRVPVRVPGRRGCDRKLPSLATISPRFPQLMIRSAVPLFRSALTDCVPEEAAWGGSGRTYTPRLCSVAFRMPQTLLPLSATADPFRRSAVPQPLTECVREDACVYLYAFLGGADAIVNTMDLLFKHVKVTGYWVSRDFHLMSREERQKEAATVSRRLLNIRKVSSSMDGGKNLHQQLGEE